MNSAFLPLFPLPDGHVETESRLVVHPRCPPTACSTCAVQLAMDELRSGRPHLALGLLAPVPDLITETTGMAWARGVGLGHDGPQPRNAGTH